MECFIPASEPRDVLVERHNRLSAAIRILNEAYQVFILLQFYKKFQIHCFLIQSYFVQFFWNLFGNTAFEKKEKKRSTVVEVIVINLIGVSDVLGVH